jgi:hypothetical protein
MLGGPLKALAAYFVLLVGSLAFLVGLSSILMRQASAELSLGTPQARPHLSRVERGLIGQARAAGHRAARRRIEVLADRVPEISAADLAKAIDAAEGTEPLGENTRGKSVMPRLGARVAGWARRKTETRYAQDAHQLESTAHIIARNLRGDI